MTETTVKIDGMMCSICETHVNDKIRNEFDVSKVHSDHKKGETVIVSDKPIDIDKLKAAIYDLGYDFISFETKDI